VVGKLRWVLENHFRSLGHTFGRRKRLKVGHGGTLDPMATGLLVIGVGTGCRQLQDYLVGAKGYDAHAQLGSETDTQDREGETTGTAGFSHVGLSQLEDAAAALTGEIMQRPPIYSALRKDGKRLHELARAGQIEPDEVPERPVTVHSLQVREFDPSSGIFRLRVRCSGGTCARKELQPCAHRHAPCSTLSLCRPRPFFIDGTWLGPCTGRRALAHR
jgi:tRNA pseudouridine55 synthase